MPGFVRAKDPVSGAEITVAEEYAQAQGLSVLDKDALDEYGRPRPAKHRTDLAGEPVESPVDPQGAPAEPKPARRRRVTEEN